MYAVGSAVSQPLSGHLTNFTGRRLGLVTCNVILAVGTLLCGLAPKEWVLLLGRAMQGIGGGGVSAVVALIENDLVPLKQRALIEGIGNIFLGVALATGSLYGGGVNDTLGWRWAFFIQVPFIVLAAVLAQVIKGIPEANNDR